MPVIPVPHQIVPTTGAPFILSPATPITCDTAVGVAMDPLAAWFMREIDRQFPDLAASAPVDDPFDPANASGNLGPAIRLELVPDDADLAHLPLPAGLRADAGDASLELYALTIAADGITIRATAPEGVFRGLTTLLQLAATTGVQDGVIALPAQEIRDTPRFAWRGFSFDVVRCAFSVEEVKRVIDLLALYKANALHLHLTDSEGWRIQIDAWPKLTEISGKTAAAGRPGLFYTKDEYRDLVQYAADRFITVIPEIEMPGHTAAIFAAYPELAGDGTHDPSETTAQATYFQAMNPDNPRIIGFIRDVLTEVAEMTPGPYLHIGGDEALGMNNDQYRRFMQAAMPIVGELGKRLIAWQEAARAGFQPGDIAQLWIAEGQGEGIDIGSIEVPENFPIPDNAAELLGAFAEFLQVAKLDLGKALDQGATILLSDNAVSYLDTKYREESRDPAQHPIQKQLGMPFYPKKTVQEFFQWDPAMQRAELSEDRIAGIEAGIWCETIASFDDLLFMLLPRLPGLMEKGWSPATVGPDFGWDAYAPRLAAQDAIWERLGLPYFRSSVVWGT